MRFDLECNLKSKVAVVTGAAGDIGRAICQRLSDNGARIAALDINLLAAEKLMMSIDSLEAFHVDISDSASVKKSLEMVIQRFEGIDILINNAGVNSLDHRVSIDNFSIKEWNRIINIDLDGMFLMSKASSRHILKQGSGRIINISSVLGLAAMRLQSPFTAAKAGMIHLTRSMALELGPKGILTNSIAPGSVLGEGTKKLFYGDDGHFKEHTKQFLSHVPLARPGTPLEIAEVVLFLASAHSSFINGQILAVDGGWTSGFMH
jgi:NAD(P)-dependent dehydrogenase (short-subunit alcohol dehydrogenase family)